MINKFLLLNIAPETGADGTARTHDCSFLQQKPYGFRKAAGAALSESAVEAAWRKDCSSINTIE
jgi:hypothetical protein